jgi:hypothetical protein
MHRVAAAEKHRIRHAGTIVVRARRLAIFPRVDIRFQNVTEVIHVIAKYRRDMILVFRKDRIRAGRRGEPRLAGGNGRFADEPFAFEKISALIGDADDDLRRAGNAVAIPVTRRRGRGRDDSRRARFHFGAAGEKGQGGARKEDAKNCRTGHLDAQSNASHSLFNSKDLTTGGRDYTRRARESMGTLRLCLPRGRLPDSLTGGGTFVHALSLDCRPNHCLPGVGMGRLLDQVE